jgi:hypothetical protein
LLADEILTFYRDQVLPLDLVANFAGCTVPQLLAHLSESSEICGRLLRSSTA